MGLYDDVNNPRLRDIVGSAIESDPVVATASNVPIISSPATARCDDHVVVIEVEGVMRVTRYDDEDGAWWEYAQD